MTILKINGQTYAGILEELDLGKKIAAIKMLRSDSGSGLKEAKEAIERLMHDQGLHDYPHAAKEGAKIVVGPVIKKLTLDFGDGDIEVDLETMQMMGLMQLQKIGLESCGEILDLVETLKAFANGQKIGVIDEGG
jgi:hypothetical protein